MIFELREYDINPGAMAEFVKLMQEEVHPFQGKFGIVLIASFTAIDDPNKYIWIRRFASEAERDRLYKAVYDSDHWKNVIKPKISPLMNRDSMKVTLLQATAISPIN